MIYDVWSHGNIDVRPITSGRIRYVLDYINQDPVFPDSKYELYGDFEPPFYHYSKGLGFDTIIEMYEKGMFDKLGKTVFSGNHTYTMPPYLKTKLGLVTDSRLYSQSVVDWKNKKGFNDYEAALKNRCTVVERVNTQSLIARGKPKIDYRKAESNIALDRLDRFHGFTDYDYLDSQIGLIV